MQRIFISHAQYVVSVSIPEKSQIVYYFRDREKAINFFYDYCRNHNLKAKTVLPEELWCRVQLPDGFVIDFDTINPIKLSCIFELQ